MPYEMQPKLYIGNRNYSSWSLRAWFLMAEAGIAFDEERIRLDSRDFEQRIGDISPSRRVPVMMLGDLCVWDSLAIAETVAERWPDKGLWPADPDRRAHARSISAEMHSGFAALRSAMPMNCRAMGRKVPLSPELKVDIDRILAIWSDCAERHGGGWLFGRFSVADAVYAPVALRFRTYGVGLPQSAQSYADRLLESKAMQKWLAAAESETEVIEAEEVGR
ncbi:MAG TPA: glutathione S-transferase family protein [Woeseiaceae bacterium]|nr:glutathione S-transferase family protein [Woeseiaceae bacterium]